MLSPFKGVRTAYDAHLWELRPARDCRIGDQLVTATGLVRITRRANTHGGVELTVCPSGAVAGHLRILWLWPQEPTYHHLAACPCERVFRPCGDAPAAGTAQDQGRRAYRLPGPRLTGRRCPVKPVPTAHIGGCASARDGSIERAGDQLAFPVALDALAREQNPPVLGRGRRLRGVRL